MTQNNSHRDFGISIVIPTYNGEKYVAEAIESAINQTSPADEIIISDDNSSDSTIEICKRYGNKVRIIENTTGPSGFVKGWNNAISHATGEFITILHQDDLLAPTFLESMVKAIESNPEVKHFFTPCCVIDENGEIIRFSKIDFEGEYEKFTGDRYTDLYELTDGHIHRCPGVITHRSIFEVCKYREDAGHIADDDFFMRVGNYTDVVGLNKVLAYYREHSLSETGHLSKIKLVRRLLDDYHFQLSQAPYNPMISEDIISFFKKWENKCCHRTIIFGLKELSFKDVCYGLGKWLSLDPRYGNITFDIKNLYSSIFKKITKCSM